MKFSKLMPGVFVLFFLIGCKNNQNNCAPVSGYEIVTVESDLNDNASKQLNVKCPKDKRVLGAGWAVLDSTNAILEGTATYNLPSFDGTSWLINAKNNSTFAKNWKLKVSCICADVCPDKAFKEYKRPNTDSAK